MEESRELFRRYFGPGNVFCLDSKFFNLIYLELFSIRRKLNQQIEKPTRDESFFVSPENARIYSL